MVNPQEQPVTVTVDQVDRIFAGTILRRGSNWMHAEIVETGGDDGHYLVILAARHRHDALKQAEEVARKAFGEGSPISSDAARWCAAIATAIEALIQGERK